VKRGIRPHGHINDLAGTRWDAIHSRLATLIDNTQERTFSVPRSPPPLARFSPHQNSRGKNGCDPKNQPCCIRYFHIVGPLLRASVPDFCRIAANALRFGADDIAQAPAKKASRILRRAKKRSIYRNSAADFPQLRTLWSTLAKVVSSSER